MAITKIDGLNWEIPKGGQSREAKERSLFEKEQGIGVNLNESAGYKANKAVREATVLRALGIAAEKIEALKAKATENELVEADLNPLSSEIRKLKRDLTRMTIKSELNSISTNPKAISGFKYLIKEKKGIKDLEGTVLLIERFQCGELSAEKLLKALEEKGVFDFS